MEHAKDCAFAHGAHRVVLMIGNMTCAGDSALLHHHP